MQGKESIRIGVLMPGCTKGVRRTETFMKGGVPAPLIKSDVSFVSSVKGKWLYIPKV